MLMTSNDILFFIEKTAEFLAYVILCYSNLITPVPSDVCSYCQNVVTTSTNVVACRSICVIAMSRLELRGTSSYRANPYNHNQRNDNRGGGSRHQCGRGGNRGNNSNNSNNNNP
ncbi:hypothetical protein PPTG_20309 [Phytophthora nicotianae INRA-310]|uniref:Uncharacterized protein n=1 Tax=Phytophthora nicotianae (strain INRA-310) TaxID=761204 RepID=W2P9I9_PHYN3|nr:hypothetical protein PPTG_20309 [Phytophthora nicotianae INRA-310]ETM97491.1 hypothetical protein PPTG_20309 [Phytophthora nicotianae INRA-310]